MSTNNTVTCHYKVLNVPLDATDAAIKKSYRKLALLYHPDKNVGRESSAQEEQFRLVQEAYDTLSDAKERAWYDEHRDAILKGWSTTNTETEKDMLFNVMHHQHVSCYHGYSDATENNFFAVYKRVFTTIAQEEVDLNLTTNFGNLRSDWTMVQQFYQEWESFVSCQTYVWVDVYSKHDMDQAPHRKVRRLMQEENKKLRSRAKKERNAEIQSLVHFVKRHDVRVQERMDFLQKQSRQIAQKKRQDQAKQKMEKQKARETWKLQAQEEMERMEQLDQQAGRIRLADLDEEYHYGKKNKRKSKKKKHVPLQSNIDDNALAESNEESVEESQSQANSDNEGEHVQDDSSSEEELLLIWKCEACRKDFKSEGQYENHIKSKKHKEKVQKCSNRK